MTSIDTRAEQLLNEIESLRALLAHTHRRLDEERRRRATDRASRALTENALAAAHERLVEVAASRDALLAEIAALRGSRSWKLGAPSRRLHHVIRRMLS